MATLAGSTIASTYPLLLKIDSNGIDGTLRVVEDGDATDSALLIATNKVEVKPGSNDANAFEVSQADGTAVFTINTSTAGATLTGTLGVTGNSTLTGDVSIVSASSASPTLLVKNTNDDGEPAYCQFIKDTSNSAGDNDEIVKMEFYHDNDANSLVRYGAMIVSTPDVSNGSEDSKIRFMTRSGGTDTDTLALESGNVSILSGNARFGVGASAAIHSTAGGADKDWGSGYDVITVGHSMQIACETSDGADRNGFLTQNVFIDGAGYKRTYNDEACLIQLRAGDITLYCDDAGTEDSAYTPTSVFQASNSGMCTILSNDTGSAGSTLKQLSLGKSDNTTWDGTNVGTFTGAIISNASTTNNTGAGIAFSHRTGSSGICYIVSKSLAADRASLHFGTRGNDGVEEKMAIGKNGQVTMGNNSMHSDGESYTGLFVSNIKTNGSNDSSDTFMGYRGHMEWADSDQGWGNLYGMFLNTQIANAAGESTSVQGIYNKISFEDGDVNNLIGHYDLVEATGGTVDVNVYGVYTDINIDSGTFSNGIWANYIRIDGDVNPSDSYYGLQVAMQGGQVHASDDYFFKCFDDQNDDTTAQITALAGTATFDGGDFSGAPDYAEYFESKDGKPITVGKTVKLDGDKVVACEDGDTPIGVVRPKGASAVQANAQTLRWQGKYLYDDYDAIQMEDYKIVKWQEEIDVDTFKGHSPHEKPEDVIGGNINYRVEEERPAILYGENDELPEGKSFATYYEEGDTIPEGKKVGDIKIGIDERVAAVPTKYYKTQSYHSDRIPKGVTVPSDAETITPNHQRKKLNPDYDVSKHESYKARSERDEWCLIGLLGQIPITKGQPVASNWIKMKDVSDTVEMYFVK